MCNSLNQLLIRNDESDISVHIFHWSFFLNIEKSSKCFFKVVSSNWIVDSFWIKGAIICSIVPFNVRIKILGYEELLSLYNPEKEVCLIFQQREYRKSKVLGFNLCKDSTLVLFYLLLFLFSFDWDGTLIRLFGSSVEVAHVSRLDTKINKTSSTIVVIGSFFLGCPIRRSFFLKQHCIVST